MKQNETNLALAAKWAVTNAEKFQPPYPFSSIEQVCTITRETIVKYADVPLLPQSENGENGHIFKLFNFLKKKAKLPADTDWERINRSLDRTMLQEILAAADKYQIDTFDYDTAAGSP